MNIELIILNLITNSGEAKSLAMEAIHLAKTGDIEGAKKHIEEAEAKLTIAHHSQTELIQAEARGDKNELSMLLIHAQDHLMTAITSKDLAAEMVDLYELVLSK